MVQILLRTYPRDHHLKPFAYKRQLVHKGFCCKQMIVLLLDQLFAIRAIFQGQRDVPVQAEVRDAVYVAQGITMHHDEVARVVKSCGSKLTHVQRQSRDDYGVQAAIMPMPNMKTTTQNS